MAVVNQMVVKDAIAVRDDIRRTVANGLRERGVPNSDLTVAPGSDTFVLATAVGNELAVVGANVIIANEQKMPDTAIGDGLANIGAIVKKAKQPAAGSIGNIILSSSSSTTIVTGAVLTDETSLRYEVITGGIYADEQAVPIRAIDKGDLTNHAEGDILRWQASPPFCDEKAVVGKGGLRNGVEAEDDEAYRRRVIAPFQNAPSAGNPEHLAEVAEESSPAVQKAFAYPAIYGPSTDAVVVTAAPTKSSKSRVLDPITVAGTVKPYVAGVLYVPGDHDVSGTVDVDVDVAFGITVPDSPTANPPGLGGGWKDGSPWPRPNGVTTFRSTVTTVISTTHFIVDAVDPPSPGVTHIAWLSPFDWKLYQAVVSVLNGGSSGAYEITIDRPFVGIVTGCYIWPDFERAQDIVDAIFASFALMGPGEKTDNASALGRGFRHPPPSVAWPNAIGPTLTGDIERASNIIAARYLHRDDGTTTITGSGGLLVPPVPASIDDPPNIYIPRHIGLYRAP